MEEGEATLTAELENESFKTQTKLDVIAVDSNAHDWGEPTYVWSADNGTVTATRICKHNDAHVQTETVSTTKKITKAAACAAKGEAIYTASFKNEAFAEQTKTVALDIDPNAHAWGKPTYTWSTDNSTVTAVRTCANDATHVQMEVASTTSKVTKTATCTEKGQTTYTATFKNAAFAKQTKTVADIAATGHTWDKVTYTWSKDLSEVTAERACKTDKTHTQKETVKTTSKVTKAATATAAGTRTYTAKFKASWAKTQTKKATIKQFAPNPTPVTLAKLTAKGKTKLKLSWNKVSGAKRYVAYFAPCNTKGKKYKLKKVETFGADETSFIKEGLEENTHYRAKIVAQKKSGGKWVTISQSKVCHAVTGNKCGKHTNAKALALTTTNMTLKKGKSATLSGLVQKAVEGEGMTAAIHTDLLRFKTSNKRVATVNAKGKVTAKQLGTCKIYVQTPNGLWKSCKVTVK